jgi:hypothetical protein
MTILYDILPIILIVSIIHYFILLGVFQMECVDSVSNEYCLFQENENNYLKKLMRKIWVKGG